MNTYFDPKEDRPIEDRPDTERPLTPVESRQGRLGLPVLIVLVAGLALALLLWGPASWWSDTADTEPPVAIDTAAPTPEAVPEQPPAEPMQPTVPPPSGQP